jgi:cytochrome P450
MTDYLAELDAASSADRFALVQRWIDTESLPFFKTLRERRPILVTDKATVVTLLDDCVEVLNQPAVFTARLYAPKMFEFFMSHDDDAFHTREKSIMQGFLNRDDLVDVRAMVGRIADELITAAGGRLEAINGYTRMVPATLVRDYFGLTGEPLKNLIEWSYWNQNDTFYNQPFHNHTNEQRQHITDEHARTSKALGHYIVELMAMRLIAVKAEAARRFGFAPWYWLQDALRWLSGKKETQLTDDIVTRMLRTHFANAVEFDLKRIGVNAGGLLIGAIETTSQAVAQSLGYLLADPALLAQARASAAAADPTAFDAIVFETLRFVPISPFLFRQTSRDAVIARGTPRETTVPAGTTVFIATQSAMFDTRAFANPDAFNPGRNWYHQFHFGYGAHECLGRYVGAVMIPEMVRRLVLRPGLRAESPIDYEGGHLPQKYQLSWQSPS